MATVVLYGDLQKYGTRFDLCVESAGEAMRALFMQLDGLRQHMSNGGYFVRVAKRDVDTDNLDRRFKETLSNDDVIHVVPEMAGGGKFGRIILGAAMIGAAFLTGGTSMAAWGWGAKALFSGGLSFALGGVAQLLIKPPSYDISQGNDSSKSSSFTNLDNISPQGAHVPIAYGYLEVGSVVVSQAIESYDIEDSKPSGDVTYTRQYHDPVPVDDDHIPDADSDEVRQYNYKLVEE